MPLEQSLALEYALGTVSTKKNVRTTIDTINRKLKKIPVVNLTIAYKPPHTHLEIFSSFLERALGQQVLLSIKTQEDLIGGAVIEFNGKYGNYTISEKCKMKS